MLSVSVVVPTYNERENIEVLLPEIHRVLGGRPHEILIVDDDSPDGTGRRVLELARELPGLSLITKKEKEGIGAALRKGYDAARNDVILSTDADLSFSPAEMLKLLEKIDAGYDLVLGCRHSGGGRYEAPTLKIKLKYSVSRLGNFVARALTGLDVRDYSANFRAIRREVWRAIETRDKTNSLLFEMILKVHSGGYRVTEVPVRFADRRFGRSKLNLAVEVPKFLLRFLVHVARLRLFSGGGRSPSRPRT